MGFFAGHPVALDLSAVRLSPSAIAHLVASLEERNIRVLGIEGVDLADRAARLPPLLRRGRGTPDIDPPEPSAPQAAVEPAAKKQQAASLLIENPVRSGESVVFIEGDITVLGLGRIGR